MDKFFIGLSGLLAGFGLIMVGVNPSSPSMVSTGAMSFIASLLMVWLSGGKVKDEGTT
jgi:hypothetical protein